MMAGELLFYQSMWAMEDLPSLQEPWTLREQVEKIAEAGYAGLSVDLGARRAPRSSEIAPLIAEHGLRSCVLVFARVDEDMRRAIAYAEAIGANWIVCCAKIFGFAPQPLADTVRRWHQLCAEAGIELQLETHRNTVTNDLRFTRLLLAELDESIMLAADLSHYVCAHEIPEQPDEEYEALITIVLDRSGSLQGRIATRSQIQVPLDHQMAQPWRQRYLGWWRQGLASIQLRRPDEPVRFLTELGPAPYAITDAAGREISDRWAEARTLLTWGEQAFRQADGQEPPGSSST